MTLYGHDVEELNDVMAVSAYNVVFTRYTDDLIQEIMSYMQSNMSS